MGEVWIERAGTDPSAERSRGRGDATPRTGVRRAAAAAVGTSAVGAFLVLSTGFTNGGYDGRSWTAVSVVLVASAAAAFLLGVAARPGKAAVWATGACALLSGWTALSAAWAPSAADSTFETRRAVLYATTLAALATLVARRAIPWLLLGLVGGVGAVGIAALAIRLRDGMPSDPLFGGLLEEPIGYPNALGALAATGAVIAIGLVVADAFPRATTLLRAGAGLLLLVVGLTESRGALLAFLIGGVALTLLVPTGLRLRALGLLAVASTVGGGAWLVTELAAGRRAALVVAVIGAAVGGCLLPAPLTRIPTRLVAIVVALAVAASAGVAARDPAVLSSSFRTTYWRAALADLGQHPVQGVGAGSFHIVWREHGMPGMDVRDAHSLYVEALSELGVVGLGLVSVVIGMPLLAAWRRRGNGLVATAGAGFVVFASHAALDWDWELPVVTLTGLGCAAALLACPSESGVTTDRERRGRGWE